MHQNNKRETAPSAPLFPDGQCSHFRLPGKSAPSLHGHFCPLSFMKSWVSSPSPSQAMGSGTLLGTGDFGEGDLCVPWKGRFNLSGEGNVPPPQFQSPMVELLRNIQSVGNVCSRPRAWLDPPTPQANAAGGEKKRKSSPFHRRLRKEEKGRERVTAAVASFR